MAESEPIAWKATSRTGFNQTARTLGNLGLSGVSQKLGRPLGRNSACSIVPRRDSGCSHQRKRANNKTPAGRRVGRSSISGDNPEAVVLDFMQPRLAARRLCEQFYTDTDARSAQNYSYGALSHQPPTQERPRTLADCDSDGRQIAQPRAPSPVAG
jgi:hypothetical protein